MCFQFPQREQRAVIRSRRAAIKKRGTRVGVPGPEGSPRVGPLREAVEGPPSRGP